MPSKFENIKAQVIIHFLIMYRDYISYHFILNVERFCVFDKVNSRSIPPSRISNKRPIHR